jgi:predicted nucleotidyltransferase
MFWWQALFKRKKNPQHDLETFINTLKEQEAKAPLSVVLFGSMASGEFQKSHSDINVLVVVAEASLAQLDALSPALQRWTAQSHPPPILLTVQELSAFSRSFPIEFLDILDHHRLMLGKDVLGNLSVDQRYLQAHCEQQLALTLLRLRQGAALAGQDEGKIRELLIHSAPSVLALFRGALRLREKVGKMTKIEAAERLSAWVHFDAEELRCIQQFHFSRKTDNPQSLLIYYLRCVEKVLTYLQSV